MSIMNLSSKAIKAISKNLSLYMLAAAVFFIFSGTLGVTRGWIYYGLVIIGAIINNWILLVHNPEVLDSRADSGSDTEVWDKLILGLYFLIQIVIIPGISGLDVRHQWSSMPDIILVLGILLYFGSLAISTWAMVTNRHFEGTVRIQKERNHEIITTGPYHYLRHPGNLGMILASFVQPLIVGSIYALIPSLLAAVLVIYRTKLEDDLLQKELIGYSEYAKVVRYKLFPKVW